MKTLSSLKTGAVLLAVGGLGFGLIGSGVRASFSDGGTATENVSVGTLACTLSSTDPTNPFAISNNGHTATLTFPAITSSNAGSDLSSLTVNNTGSMPEVVTWTVGTTGLSSKFTPAPGSPLVATPVTLAAGANQPYTGLGVNWTTLA
jgi:hypothetical protein